MPVTAADIEHASHMLEDVIERTPVAHSRALSRLLGSEVHIKCENLQRTGSFKVRGVAAKLEALGDVENGVVAASAGNHAQGVAFACRSMQVPGRIYVPTTTPKQKRDRIRWHGGDFVELKAVGDTYDAAAAAAQDDVMRTGSAWIHAFDDPRTAAGQGTIAHEIVEQLGRVPDVVVAPVGGGGCLAGMATYFRGLSEHVTIVGVEPTGAVSLSAALVNGGPVTLAEIDPFVDGAAVKRIGTIGHRVLSEMGATVTDHPVLASITDVPAARVVPDERHAPVPGTAHITHVDEGAICSAMLELYQNEGIIAEPAGALAVAILDKLQLPADSTVVCLVSGGNNDVSRYGEIIERSLVHLSLIHI